MLFAQSAHFVVGGGVNVPCVSVLWHALTRVYVWASSTSLCEVEPVLHLPGRPCAVCSMCYICLQVRYIG